MKIEKIASKLKPIMPDKIQHWMRARELAEPELKELIDKQIISTAHKHLGDFNSKILLSQPPASKAKGAINLGKIIYDTEKWPVGISTNELTQNMAVFGRSGSGKTNVSFHILMQLVARKIPFVFLDWKRTVRHLLPQLKSKINIYTAGRPLSKFPFNPFVIPPGVESNVYINQIVDIMSKAFTLGDGSRSILRKAIASHYNQGNYCPTITEIIAEVEKIPGKERVGGWKISALRALESMDFSGMTSGDRISQEQLTAKLMHENTVIELDALAQESKKFLVPILCLWMYYVRLKSSDREKLKLVVFIEEAHHVLHGGSHSASETVLEMLFRQCRELGIGMIVLDQHPHLISSAVMGNTHTTICLNQKDPKDIGKAAALSLVEEKEYFSMLPIGQGIVKLQDRWTRPFLVQFPLINVDKGAITDTVLARYLRSLKDNPTQKPQTAYSGKDAPSWNTSDFSQIPQVPLYDNALGERCLEFLEDVITHPEDGVKQRYFRLDLSIGMGSRIKDQLLGCGWLEGKTIDLGKTRKVILRIPTAAMKSLGLSNNTPYRASLTHEYWKQFYATRFRELGHKIDIESPRNSGAVDILATRDGKSIAIEIETGKSDIIRNVKQNLLSSFGRIMIVATNEKALAKVEREIAATGLYGITRIHIVLKEGGVTLAK